MDTIRIQIVNYKTKKYLIECLETLAEDLQGSDFPYSIVILDNNSGDDLSDIPSMFPSVRIDFHQGKENLGFGAGHNFLSRQGQAEYILILNPDTKIIEPDTIKRLLESIKRSSAQALGPRLVTKHSETQMWDHGELYGVLAQIALNSGNSYWKERNNPIEVAWVSGAVFLIEKSWFDRLGGFDKNFFLYKEEEDLCLRLRKIGGHVFYDTTISILHYGGVVAKKSEHMQKSVDYFIDKHFRKKIGYSLFKLLNKLVH